MIVRKIRGKIIRTVLCSVVYDRYTHTHTHTHTYEQFLKMSLGLGLCYLGGSVTEVANSQVTLQHCVYGSMMTSGTVSSVLVVWTTYLSPWHSSVMNH